MKSSIYQMLISNKDFVVTLLPSNNWMYRKDNGEKTGGEIVRERP